MFLAHAGHTHETTDMSTMSAIDHCMPIIVGAGIIIALLLGVIIYLLVSWHPKTHASHGTPKKSNKK